MSKTLQQRLEAVLAAYGADPLRWPEEERSVLAPYLAGSRDALAEARELDRILDLASVPREPQQSANSILRAIEADPPASNIVRLPPSRPAILPWLSALPLAASLALGFYLGAQGSLDSLLPSSITGEVLAAGDDPADLSGMSDAEELTGDGLT